MICTKCGAPMAEGETVCPYCGAAVKGWEGMQRAEEETAFADFGMYEIPREQDESTEFADRQTNRRIESEETEFAQPQNLFEVPADRPQKENTKKVKKKKPVKEKKSKTKSLDESTDKKEKVKKMVIQGILIAVLAVLVINLVLRGPA